MSLTNSFKFRGNLVADPELRDINANGEVIKKVNFRVAIHNGKLKNGQDRPATFVDVEAFRGTADVISRYFHKGDEIWCEGEVRTDSWVSQDGTKRSRLFVSLTNFEYGRQRKNATAAVTAPQVAPVPAQPQYQAPIQQNYAQPTIDEAMGNAFGQPDMGPASGFDPNYADNSGVLI